MHKLISLVLSFGFLVVLLIGSSAGSTIEEAKKEGTVVLYGSMPIDYMHALTKAFEKKYTFLKVKTFRGNNEKVRNRVLTEGQARSYFVDVISIDGINGWILKEKGYLQAHKSKETEAFPKKFRDPEGLLPCCTYVLTNVIGYNTKMVAKKDVPKTYQDLLDPKWKGNLGMDSDEGEWFRALISIWGKEKTVHYFRALMKQQPSMRRGHTLLAKLTAAGEFAIGVNVFGHRPLELKAKGAPIDIVQALPVIAAPRHVSLAKRAPHPHAGRLFVDFVLSSEGQGIIASRGRVVVRPGLNLVFPRLVKGLKLHPIVPEMAKDFNEISKLYYSIVK